MGEVNGQRDKDVLHSVRGRKALGEAFEQHDKAVGLRLQLCCTHASLQHAGQLPSCKEGRRIVQGQLANKAADDVRPKQKYSC